MSTSGRGPLGDDLLWDHDKVESPGRRREAAGSRVGAPQWKQGGFRREASSRGGSSEECGEGMLRCAGPPGGRRERSPAARSTKAFLAKEVFELLHRFFECFFRHHW